MLQRQKSFPDRDKFIEQLYDCLTNEKLEEIRMRVFKEEYYNCVHNELKEFFHTEMSRYNGIDEMFLMKKLDTLVNQDLIIRMTLKKIYAKITVGVSGQDDQQIIKSFCE
jgi:hypothetical protein